jgi:nucleoside-diphosphate-sugar epimerase
VRTHCSAWRSASSKKHQAARQDVDEVDYDGYGDGALAGFDADPIELVVVAVDQGDPVSTLLRITAGGLVEDRPDHLRRVVGDRGGQPLAAGSRRGPGLHAFGVGGWQDVGDRAWHRAMTSREHALRSITASIARARETLGYCPRHTSLDALREALRWLVAHGHMDVGGQAF